MSALLLPDWDQLAVDRPVMVATMGRYLEQVACTLRPASVGGADLALRCFAAFLAEAHPEVRTVARSDASTSRTSSPG